MTSMESQTSVTDTAKTVRPFRLHSRYYQPSVFKELTELVPSEPEVALLLPTGSGKTTLILSLIAWAFAQTKPPFDEIYVIAPQKTVRDGFRGNGIDVRRFQVNPGEACYKLQRVGKLRNLDIKLLETPAPGTTAWFAETHSVFAFNELLKDLQGRHCPADFRGKLLVVDEGHHAKMGNNIRAFIDYWVANGGHVLYATATPGDGIPDTAKLIQRTLTELMAPPCGQPPCAPTNILSNFIDTGLAEDSEQDDGTRCAPIGTEAELRNVFEDMATRWNAAGRPKTIVRIKPKQDTQHNIKMLLMAKKAFEDVGASAFAVKAETDRIEGLISSEELSGHLAKERSRSYTESEFDVIITLNTMIEGADWPLCSHVYLWGVPGSCQTTVQVLGRATRLRTGIKGYPPQWRETTQIVFFVGGVSDLRNTHGTAMLLVGCSLASYTLGAQWSAFREHLKLVKEHPQILEPAREEETAVIVERKAEIGLEWEVTRLAIKEIEEIKGRVPDSLFREDRRNLCEAYLNKASLLEGPERRFAKSLILGSGGSEWLEKYPKAMKERLQTESFSEAHKAALDELLEQFLSSTEVFPGAGTPTVLENMGVLRLTAPVLEDLKEKMFKECPPSLSKAKVVSNTRSFVLANSHLAYSDFLDSIDPASPDGYTFRAYDEAIRSGSRGMEKQELGLGIVVCERKGWAEDPKLGDIQGDTKKVRAARLKTTLVGFFFGDICNGLTEGALDRLTVAEAVRISQAKWTPKQYNAFEDRLKHMAVQEALDASL